MNTAQMTNLVGKIAEYVHGESDGSHAGCSPVEMSIGYVNNITVGDGIVITKAPPAITRLISEWIEKAEIDGPRVTMQPGHGGLLVR